MVSEPTSTQPQPGETTWNEIEDLVHDVAALSKSDISTREFYSELLDRAVSALAANGGAIWTLSLSGQITLEYQINLSETGLPEDEAAQQSHAQLLSLVFETGVSKIIPPRSGPEDVARGSNPTGSLLIICPLLVENEAVGIVELFQRPNTSPAAQQGYMRFIEALCELAADFHRNQQLRDLKDRASLWGQFEQFAEHVHGSLDLKTTAYVIANEGRRLIGCDRISFAVRRGSKCRLMAISGVDTIERRANSIRCLEKIIKAVVAVDEPLWYTGKAVDRPPQIDKPLQAYLDESHSRLLAVIPLKEPPIDNEPHRQPKLLGAIVVERFETDRTNDALERRVNAVCSQSELAIRNVLTYHSIPLLILLKLVQKIGWLTQLRQLPKTIVVLAAITAAVLALIFVPADFEIEGRGELQPKIRRNIFAGSDGVIREVLVEHSDFVKKGDLVAVLGKSQLDFEFSRILGEIQTSRKQLATVQASRLGSNPVTADAQVRYNQLTAEEEELKELLKSLEEQYAILQKQQRELEARSPIDGQVLTWNVSQTLEARPVTKGQTLLSVANTDGPWVLEIQVSDNDVGHVSNAQKELKPDLDVSFVLATDPGTTYSGTVNKISMISEVGEENVSTVLVTVRIDRNTIPVDRRRPGATVVPKIYCGRRSVGYVWLRELFETIQKRLLF